MTVPGSLKALFLSGVLCLCISGSDATEYHPPSGAEDDPNLFWFGTQPLSCIKGKAALAKRSLTSDPAASRSTLRYLHRLLYFRGTVYEWGPGTRGYYIAPRPFSPTCDVQWEDDPAGYSTCSLASLTSFAQRYRSHFGGYHVIHNNCHNFVNRLSRLLSSSDCAYNRAAYPDETRPKFSKRLWSFFTVLVHAFRSRTGGRTPSPAVVQ